MADFGDLVDDVISTLHGHTTDVPALGSLTSAIDASSTSFTVDFGDSPGAARPNGFIEIGSELIAVSRYNPQTSTITCAGWGRGQRGTSAVSHSVGDMVTVRPRYPRHQVQNAINDALTAAVPMIYAVRDLDDIIIDSLPDLAYPLPDDTLRVLRVEATTPGPFAHRRTVRDWTVRSRAGSKELELHGCAAYQTVSVTLAALPGRLTAESGDFTDQTGLPDSMRDIAYFGALSRLVLANEAARQQVTSVEANTRNDKVPSGSGTTLARFYQALLTQRLDAEQSRLQQTFPITLLRRG